VGPAAPRGGVQGGLTLFASHFGWQALARTGKREQAREQLATATTMYRDMGMTYWLEKAEAEMAELDR
jgi:hypothetical protein